MPVRLLVIDDNPFVRRLYETRARQRTDVHLDSAESAYDALSTIEAAKHPYDLIVCDEHLGRRMNDDGVAFVQVLANLSLPVALITDGTAHVSGLAPNVRVLMRPVGLEELIEIAQIAAGPR